METARKRYRIEYNFTQKDFIRNQHNPHFLLSFLKGQIKCYVTQDIPSGLLTTGTTQTMVCITYHDFSLSSKKYIGPRSCIYHKRRERRKKSPSDHTTHIFTFSSFDVSETHKQTQPQTMMLQMISALIGLV